MATGASGAVNFDILGRQSGHERGKLRLVANTKQRALNLGRCHLVFFVSLFEMSELVLSVEVTLCFAIRCRVGSVANGGR